MTTHTTVRDHTVVGTATQLTNLIANHHTAGTLVALTAPRPVTGGRYQLVIRLREHGPVQPSTRITSPRIGRRRLVVTVTAVTGMVAGLLAVAAYLLGQLVELITAHAGPILGVLALAAILAGLSTRRPPGRKHCPGC